LVFFIQPPKNDETYTLELVQEKFEDYTEQSQSYQCPLYSFDFMLSSTEKILKVLKCPSKSSHTMEYKLPEENPKFTNFKYKEFVPFSYFTENQVSQFIKTNQDSNNFLYQIRLNIETNSFISIEVGYDHLVSLLDIYLTLVETGEGFKSSVVAVGNFLLKNDDEEQLPYRKMINMFIPPGNYVLSITENMWSTVNKELHNIDSNKKEEFCLPFAYNIDVLPQNENETNLHPQILSVFPSGRLIFIGDEDDLRLTLTLNKTPFTHKKQPITGTHNFMTIINTFYLSEKLTMRNHDNINPQNEEGQIYADKIEGNDDGKEWILTFMQIRLKQGYDYELKFKPNSLFDFDYKSFASTIQLPTFRIELDKISQMNLNKMEELRVEGEKINHVADLKEETKKEEPSNVDNEVKSKCGKHGVERYDNIYKKWLCSCNDGYTGKYCDICNGVIDKVNV